MQSVMFLQRYDDELMIVVVDSAVDSGRSMRSSREGHAVGRDPEAMLWTCPGKGLVKINSDASFLADSGHTLAGIVAKDYKGLIFFSLKEDR